MGTPTGTAKRPVCAQATSQAVPTDAVLRTWRKADLVCFDVDSTFCTDESIDELAAFLGVGDEVAELTRQAMGGSVKFQDALKARLDVMRPSASDIERFQQERPAQLSAGIAELVKDLQAKGTAVALVSGGFRQIIEPIASSLGIPHDHVHANNLLFAAGDGSYEGFDAAEFTSRSGGKAEACKHLRAAFGYGTVVMVGDGATDAEARQPGGADIFVCYGGVVLRDNVAEKADWVVMDVQALIDAL